MTHVKTITLSAPEAAALKDAQRITEMSDAEVGRRVGRTARSVRRWLSPTDAVRAAVPLRRLEMILDALLSERPDLGYRLSVQLGGEALAALAYVERQRAHRREEGALEREAGLRDRTAEVGPPPYHERGKAKTAAA
jgi:hypothetical protein